MSIATNPAADLLRAAAALIADPENWLKGDSARTAAGVKTHPGTPWACKFCASGALTHAALRDDARYSYPTAWQLLSPWGDKIVDYNDDPDTTHAMIMARFEVAAAAAEA